VSECERAPTGGGCLSGRAGARARARMRAGPAGLIWAEMGFSIFLEFPNAFLFIFSSVLIPIQTNIQIQTNSNMCINSKNILSSAWCNIS
jgi:hypothetical protein